MLHPFKLTCLLAVLLVPAGLAVAPPARPLGPPEVQRLIHLLGDRDYRVRDHAEQRLFQEGLTALALLKKAMGSPDPEIRRRASRLVPRIEHLSFIAPKRITAKFHNQPLTKIFEEISKQTGYKIQHMGGPGRVALAVGLGGVRNVVPAGEATYSYTFVNETFWNVIDRLCRDANLTLQQGYGDDTVRLFSSGGYAPYTGQDGAFRYAATTLQMYRSVDLNSSSSTTARQESLTLSMVLFAEPRLPFLGMGEPRLEVAYDSERNSLIPSLPSPDHPSGANGPFGGFGGRVVRSYYNGGYKQMSLPLSLTLQRVSEKATAIKQLKGVVPVTLLVEQKPVNVLDNFLEGKGKKKSIDELEFNVENVQKMANNQYQVKFTVTNKGNVNDYSWQNTLYQRLELLDAKGVKYQNWGSSWHGGGGNHVTMTLTYSGQFGGTKPGPPVRFVYQHWVTRQHDISFEFKDVPLP